MSVELRVMRYVIAVAEEGGFQRAADRLHMAQPPLSRQIATLERDLGVALFHRRPTRLTPAGEIFVESARRLLSEADLLVERTRLAATRGTVRIGYVPSVAYDTLPHLLAAARAAHPCLHVDAREGWSPELGQALYSGRLDLVISHSVPHSDALDRTPLRHEPLVALVSADHRLAGRDAIRLTELSGDTFCFHERSLAPAYHDLVLSALPDGFRVWEHPVPGLRLNPLLPDGTGFTLLSASAAALMPVTLRALPLLDDLPTVPVELLWHPASLTPEAGRLLDTARTLALARSWI